MAGAKPFPDADDPSLETAKMLEALDTFEDHGVVITGVNADPGHDRVARLLGGYADERQGRVSLHPSLGQLRYLSAMKQSAAVIGNSSSGIIEAPAMGVPTVNIGDRQKGRLRAPSIIDCTGKTNDIASAIDRALDPGFRAGLRGMVLPYGSGGSSKKIKDKIKVADLSRITRKSFQDISFHKAST
jgi:UDP-N-acetylglucosamine 2-epimerase